MPSASGPVRSDATSARSAGVESACSAFKGIFRRYLELGCVRLLKNELDRRGIVSKVRIAKSGTRSGGKPFSRGALYALLANPLYIGEIRRRAPPHYAHRLRTHSAGTSSCPLERAGGGARPRLAPCAASSMPGLVGFACSPLGGKPPSTGCPAAAISPRRVPAAWRTSYGEHHTDRPQPQTVAPSTESLPVPTAISGSLSRTGPGSAARQRRRLPMAAREDTLRGDPAERH
jgi:hypothetical protein